MTNREAIEQIKIAIAEAEWEFPLDYTVAMETAIHALEDIDNLKEHLINEMPMTEFMKHFSKNHDALLECEFQEDVLEQWLFDNRNENKRKAKFASLNRMADAIQLSIKRLSDGIKELFDDEN